MTNNWPTYEEIEEFYGDPDRNSDGRPDVAWESANLVKIKPPYPMVWAWTDKNGIRQPVRTITLHKKCAPAFLAALEDIRDNFNEFDRARYQLNRCGGGYNFRTMRGHSSRLSTHAYGAALDLAPEINWLGRKYDAKLRMMPMQVVEFFAKRGIRWGGNWQRPDSQHFQAVL
jgi:hypothetical protein